MSTYLPNKLVTSIGKEYPHVWKAIDVARAMKGTELKDWDDAVFLPYAAWYNITEFAQAREGIRIADAELMNRIAFAGTWRVGQDIVRFDKDVMQSLAETPFDGSIPTDILWRLPCWCVYVDVSISMYYSEWQGFMAMLEEDANDGHRELRLLFLNDAGVFYLPIHLGNWSLGEAYYRMLRDAFKNATKLEVDSIPDDLEMVIPGLRVVMSYLLYICAYGLTDNGKSESKPSYPSPKKTKNGWRLFPPDKPKVHLLGAEFGRQIRAGRETVRSRSHAGPRPHIRRAHWHSYWTGPKASQKIVVHWLPPIPVAMGEDEEK